MEDLLVKKVSDYEVEAKQSAINALSFATESETANNTITLNLEEVNLKLEELNNIFLSFGETTLQIQKYFDSSKENSEIIKSTYDFIEGKSILIQSQIAEIEKIIENKPILDDKLLKLDAIFLKADDNDSKLRNCLNLIK